jgi:dipeptidyl aminopeptidase/acylaminoacyl peptidase
MAWSPDGQTLAVTYYHDDLEGSTVSIQLYDPGSQRITDLNTLYYAGLPGDISWSPNERYLLVGRYTKLIIDISTGEVLNTFSTSLNTNTFWSPDGERLVFTSEQILPEKEKRLVQAGNAFSMAVFEIGQGEPRAVFEGTHDLDYFALAWLPDGRVFYKQQDWNTSDVTYWTVRLNGKAREPRSAQDIPLAFDKEALRALLPVDHQNAGALSLSADERWLLYAWGEASDGHYKAISIYLLDLKAGGDPIRLTDGTQPVWRPDPAE